ncbi:MAG TPA: alpha-amylase family glycosyl hydrolase, partial [Burkholderiales bacterium]|nr:alpha-amylase family glycosyl hydrolase [Burkholderiales bacterium]
LGPTLSFRGVDNASYYRLAEDDRRHYVDFTGCGNTLNLEHPRVLQMVMDSLRYWVEEMHVDGFRFDLAPALAREGRGVEPLGGFFTVVRQDPVLSRVKLIAEPWDVGEGGYQVGNFPLGWAEWNDRYRNGMRAYWKGDGGVIGEFARRLTGSSDLYGRSGKRPHASVNFVTAHDGFTLHDLVSYNDKHNEANKEGNRDGNDANHSWNCGVEGDTDDPAVLAIRRRQMRNFIATLMLSQGVPMLLGGDEFARTQGGNNNAYCQDSEVSWIDWAGIDDEGRALIEFTRRLIRLRREHVVFCRTRFFYGKPIPGTEVKDVTWLRPDGAEMGESDWKNPLAKALGVLLSGEAGLTHLTARGEQEPDDTFFMTMNASETDVVFRLPVQHGAARWMVLVDSSDGLEARPERVHDAGAEITVSSRSMLVFVRQAGAEPRVSG